MMGITPSRIVPGGFFRVHLWVLLGLATFECLAVYSRWTWFDEHAIGSARLIFGLGIAAAIVSYVGAVVWMYDARSVGKVAIWSLSGLFLASGYFASSIPQSLAANHPASLSTIQLSAAASADWLTSGLLLGSITAAMLLGHYYLNAPGMKLDPIKRLMGASALSLVARAVVVAIGLTVVLLDTSTRGPGMSTLWWSMFGFRLLSGIIGPMILAYMTWETLKIPNTQSATGILYAAVTIAFLGELTAQLLSRSLAVPL